MFKNSKEKGGGGGTRGRVCQVWDKSRKGEKKSLPKRIKVTCRELKLLLCYSLYFIFGE